MKNWLIVSFCTLVIMLCPTPATASSIFSLEQVTVLHSSPEKSLFLGQDQFKFRHFVDDSGRDAEAVAIADLTLTPDNDSILFKKHAVNTADNLYITEGSLQCVVEASERPIELKGGDLLKVPAGVPYGCKVTGDSPSHLMLITSSPVLENLITEIGNSDSSAAAVMDLTMEEIVNTAQKYGINFLN